MAIIIDQEQKLITLHTKNTTYQMGVGNYGQLLHLYYGKRLTGDMRYLLTYYDRGFSGNPYEAECDKTYSMDALPQEYPCFGNGDFRSPGIRKLYLVTDHTEFYEKCGWKLLCRSAVCILRNL